MTANVNAVVHEESWLLGLIPGKRRMLLGGAEAHPAVCCRQRPSVARCFLDGNREAVAGGCLRYTSEVAKVVSGVWASG